MKIGLIGSPGQFNYKKFQARERYTPELYKNLKILNNKTYKIEIKKIPVIGRAFSIYAKLLFKDFSNYDIIHNLSQDPLFLLKKKNAKLVTTVHLSPGQLSIQPKNFKQLLWLNTVIKLSYSTVKKSDYIIANSTQTKEDIINFFKINRNKIFVIDLGIDKRYFKKVKNNHENKTINVGYLGALIQGKQIDFGIKAANLLKDKNIYFSIWGGIFDKNYYSYITKLSSNNKNIKFFGYAPEEKIVNIYDTFDIFVFPSLYESFGLPIIEAQSRGLPVIIYKNGKIPKEVRRYCFEADSPENMAEIIKNIKENGYNEKKQKKAIEYAQSFTWEKCSRETFEIYKIISNK
jgi:glycosyltransferase involved in cell wall biosynthesis